MITIGKLKKEKEKEQSLYPFPFITLKAKIQSEDKSKLYNALQLSKTAFDILFDKSEVNKQVNYGTDNSNNLFLLKVNSDGLNVGINRIFYSAKLYNHLIKTYDLNEEIDNHFILNEVEDENFEKVFQIEKIQLEITEQELGEIEILSQELID
jgi:hypothetical protein